VGGKRRLGIKRSPVHPVPVAKAADRSEAGIIDQKGSERKNFSLAKERLLNPVIEGRNLKGDRLTNEKIRNPWE